MRRPVPWRGPSGRQSFRHLSVLPTPILPRTKRLGITVSRLAFPSSRVVRVGRPLARLPGEYNARTPRLRGEILARMIIVLAWKHAIEAPMGTVIQGRAGIPGTLPSVLPTLPNPATTDRAPT